jgi:hypothetical protein
MSEMVDRVAKAIDGRWNQGAMTSKELARVAIAAMREPTEEMLAAAYDPSDPLIDTWQAMIDTAIHGPVPATADPIGFDLPQGERE